MTNTHQFIKDQSGFALIYTVLIMLPILGIAGFAIDSGYIAYINVRLQNAADAAALAGANVPPSETNETALSLADANMPTSHYGSVLNTNDIVEGFWDEGGNTYADTDYRTFYPDDSATSRPINAIKVTTSYTPSLNLMGLFGFNNINLKATAIATIASATPPNFGCLDTGFVALGTISANNGNVFNGDSACFYAEEGISFGNNNCFGLANENSMFFGAPDSLELGGMTSGSNNTIDNSGNCLNTNNSGNNTDIIDYFQQLDIVSITSLANLGFDLSDPDSIRTLINSASFQAQLEGIPSTPTLTLYTPSNYNNLGDLTDQIVIFDGDISFSPNAEITNSYVIATGDIALKGQIGTDDYCTEDSNNNSLIMAAGDITTPGGFEMFGAQLISGGSTSLNSGGIGGGISIASGGDINLTSNWVFSNCKDTQHFMELDAQVSGGSTLVF